MILPCSNHACHLFGPSALIKDLGALTAQATDSSWDVRLFPQLALSLLFLCENMDRPSNQGSTV